MTDFLNGSSGPNAIANFDKGLVVNVVRNLIQSLRAGTPWLPAGSAVPISQVPGKTLVGRFMNVSDLVDLSGSAGNITSREID
jgi:hypothetical protein